MSLIDGHLGMPLSSEAREARKRERLLHVARKSGWPELGWGDLEACRGLGLLHVPTGRFFAVSRGEVAFGPGPIVAWSAAPDGIVFLEEPAGPKTVDELDARRAARPSR